MRSAGVRYIAMNCSGVAASSTSVNLNGQGELNKTFTKSGPSVAATHHSASSAATQRTSDETTTPVLRKKEMMGPALSLPLKEKLMAATPGRNSNQDVTPPLPFDPSEKMTLEKLSAAVEGCVRCPLGHSRTNIVFGVGNPKADLLFVGEAPGRDEDTQGIPFVGRAGQMLTRMIENVIEIPRSEVYICNILKCRPPSNRNPEPGEIACCEPYLHKQLEIISPRLIVALGKFAAQWLLATQTPIGKLRGKFGRYRHIPTLATYHPAYLLRNPSQKRTVMEDLLRIKAILVDKVEPAIEIHS